MGLAESITLPNFELTRLFFAIVSLLASAHLFGYVFEYWKLPRVVGEIMGGFVLGPTILGFFLPDVHQWIFQAFPEEGRLLSLVYWFGLVFLMFISGFEIEKSIHKRDVKTIIAILLGATVMPFLAGWFAPSFYDFSPYLGAQQNMLALQIIIAIAVAVTSIPVISKIFLDLGIIHTRFAKIVLVTATIQDVLLWVALAVAAGLVGSGAASFSSIPQTIGITLAFFAVLLVVLPTILAKTKDSRWNFFARSSATGYILLICFLFAAAASILNVQIVFGAFLAGIVVGLMSGNTFQESKKSIKEISFAFFIPLYFAIVGLKLDLVHHFDLVFFLGFLLFSTILETVGTVAAVRMLRYNWFSSINFGVAMNTRGGPGIVLATVAFDLGIINESFFVTLVLMAIVTSLGAGYWFRFLLSKGITFVHFKDET